MSTGNGVLGTMAGIAIGGIAGILFAPKKGLKTRKKIMAKSEDYLGELKSWYNKSRDSNAKKFENTKKDAEGLVNKKKAKYDEAIKDIKDASENLKHHSVADMKHATS